MLMQAFGGEGYAVNSRQQLVVACRQAFAARRPALINVAIDPLAGVESGAPAVLCVLPAILTDSRLSGMTDMPVCYATA